MEEKTGSMGKEVPNAAMTVQDKLNEIPNLTGFAVRGMLMKAWEEHVAPKLQIGNPEHAQLDGVFGMVLKKIGACRECYGAGTRILASPSKGTGYRIRRCRDMTFRYEYPCWVCNGNGIVLDKKCESCGADFPTLAFKTVHHCSNCRAKIDARSGLIPLADPRKAENEKEDKTQHGSKGSKPSGTQEGELDKGRRNRKR